MDTTFLHGHAVEAAKRLLGCRLIRKDPETGFEAEVIITETEAYGGADDPASHAHRGPTPRNRVMFGPPGRLYVYFTYGMHYCMNIVTGPEGEPGAVLLRAAKPVSGLEHIRANRPGIPDSRLMDGPAKLTKALEIDLRLNGYDLLEDPDNRLALVVGPSLAWKATPRIGISKATDYLWRFVAEP